MTMNPLPPQAYTKETLLKAYQWLMVQNSSLKDIATTPDILVSLYLKATRDGDSALDRPSIVNFKNELRSLAGMMGELDRPAGSHSVQPNIQSHAQSHAMPQTPMAAYQELKSSAPQQMTMQAQVVAAHLAAQQTPVQNQAPAAAPEQPLAQFKNQPQKAPAQTMTSAPVAAQTQVASTQHSLVTTPQSADFAGLLDCASLAMIQEVKSELNLSSESEALRMLVKIGFNRSKGLLS